MIVGERIHSLDTLKGIALLMVFFIHARVPYLGGSFVEEATGFLLLNLSRLAVPVFFLISGYLLKMNLEDQETPLAEWNYIKNFALKVGKYYIIGSALFIGVKVAVVSINRYLELEIVSSIITLDLQWSEILFKVFYTGKLGSDHLWFLLTLFYAIIIVYIFYRYEYIDELLIGSMSLHLIGIISRVYMILPQLPIPRDDLLFFGLFFTTAGFYTRQNNLGRLKSSRSLLGAAFLMNILHIVERVFLSIFSEHTPFFWLNYSFFTAPAALAVFLYFLKKNELGKNWRINRYGGRTLWIYILHPLALGLLIGVSEMLDKTIGFNSVERISWTILVTLVAYFGSAELITNSSVKEKFGEKLSSVLSRLSII